MNIPMPIRHVIALALATIALPGAAAPTASALKADSNINLAVAPHSRLLVFDADGDEDPDIWVGGTRDGHDILLTQTSDRRWMRHTIASGVGAPVSAVSLDANNDFARDIAVARDDAVSLFINDGKGQLRRAETLRGCKAHVHTLLAGDLDRDGRADILALTDGAPCLWKNRGGAHPFGDARVPTTLAELTGVRTGALLDLDGDGRLDLVVTTRDAVLVYGGEGNGRFRRPRPLASGGFDVLTAGDYNNDGRTDLFLASSAGAPQLLLNAGGGRFRAESIAWAHGPIKAAMAADLTNSDQLGLLVAAEDGTWFVNPRNGKSWPFRGGADATVLAVADLDRDGRLDWIERDDDGALTVQRNRTATGHWVSVQLRGHDNRATSGARIVVTLKDGTKLTRVERAGEPHHLGIGRRTDIDAIQVFWPSGRLTQMPQPPIDRHLGFLEPTGNDASVQRAKPIVSVSTEPSPHRTLYCK